MSRREKDAENRILGVAEGFSVLALVALALAFVVLCGGCANTGSRVVVGEQCALPEVSDAADNFSARIYEDIKGASVWTRKDSEVRVAYRCAYTNSYFGLLHTQSDMTLDVTVTPLAEQGQEDGTSETSGTTETDAPLTAAQKSGAFVPSVSSVPVVPSSKARPVPSVSSVPDVPSSKAQARPSTP